MGKLYPLTAGNPDSPVPGTRDPPVFCTTSEGGTYYIHDSPVPDIDDLPVSCTTSEGGTHYNTTPDSRTSSLISLLSDRHIYIRQRSHRHPHETMRFAHTTIIYHVLRHRNPARIRRRELPANLPNSPREASYSQHYHTTHSLRVPRRGSTRKPIRRLAPHRARPISHIYRHRSTNHYIYTLRAQNYAIATASNYQAITCGDSRCPRPHNGQRST